MVMPKMNGKWRVCVDYKDSNIAKKRNHFSLPFQDEVLDEVIGYKCYMMCDWLLVLLSNLDCRGGSLPLVLHGDVLHKS